MLHLDDYAAYWEHVARRCESLKQVCPVTVSEDMGRRLQSMKPTDFPALFYFPPGAEGSGHHADDFTEENICVVMVLMNFDPQRSSSFEALRKTQPIIEEIKRIMLDDQCRGCQLMRINTSTINTMPETDLYRTLAGWSIGFRAKSL